MRIGHIARIKMVAFIVENTDAGCLYWNYKSFAKELSF